MLLNEGKYQSQDQLRLHIELLDKIYINIGERLTVPQVLRQDRTLIVKRRRGH